MMDWNHNGSYDAFDSATDYMLSEDFNRDSSEDSLTGEHGVYSSAKYAANQKDKPVPPQEEMKPWQYLVTIFSSLIFLYSFVILVLMPEFVLEALQDLFGDYLLALIFGSMIVIGMWLYVIVTRDES